MDIAKHLQISGFTVQSTTSGLLAVYLLDAILTKRKTTLFFANTNFIVKCRFLLAGPKDGSVILVNDGVGMDIAAQLLHGKKFEENLNGTDFIPYLLKNSARTLNLFMIGATEQVLAKAIKHVVEQLGQNVVGSCDGYQGLKDSAGLVARINEEKPDIVLVGMGNPIQEEWIMRHRHEIEASIFIGVGALFDFWSGGKRRAPLIFRRFRLEWFYRLCLEPRRLMRRYTFDIALFLRHCFKYR